MPDEQVWSRTQLRPGGEARRIAQCGVAGGRWIAPRFGAWHLPGLVRAGALRRFGPPSGTAPAGINTGDLLKFCPMRSETLLDFHRSGGLSHQFQGMSRLAIEATSPCLRRRGMPGPRQPSDSQFAGNDRGGDGATLQFVGRGRGVCSSPGGTCQSRRSLRVGASSRRTGVDFGRLVFAALGVDYTIGMLSEASLR